MRHLIARACLLLVVLTTCGTALWSQTDVAVSGYGAFNGSTSKDGTVESPSNQAGFLIEARHIKNPLIGYEITYAYNRANQGYMNSINLPCPVDQTTGCGPERTWASVPANAHEITGDWLFSLKFGAFHPFALAGGGVLVNAPSSGSVTATSQICETDTSTCEQTTTNVSTSTQTKGVFVYGAGVDWAVIPHFGLRFQYRGNLYKAPQLAQAFRSTDSFTHSAQPMIGAYFRF